MIILENKPLVINSPAVMARQLQKWLRKQDEFEREKEYFLVVLLDARKKIKCIDVVSVGIVDATLVHPREVFRRAIAYAASDVIVAHTHPSSVCDPSDEDLETTERLSKAGKVIGIQLVDHLIFSASDYYSFVEHGRV